MNGFIAGTVFIWRDGGGRNSTAGGDDLVHEHPQSLDPPFPLHQVSGAFWRAAGEDLVHEHPQSLDFPFPLHQVSGAFWRAAGGDLVHELPQSLDSPFPLHQVTGAFCPPAVKDCVRRPAHPTENPCIGQKLDRYRGLFSCARHGTSLTGESPVTGIYRQV